MRERSPHPWVGVTSMVSYRLGWGHAFVWPGGAPANLSAECRGLAKHRDGAREVTGCRPGKGVLRLQSLNRPLPTLLMKPPFPARTPSPRSFQLRTEGGARAELSGAQPTASPSCSPHQVPEEGSFQPTTSGSSLHVHPGTPSPGSRGHSRHRADWRWRPWVRNLIWALSPLSASQI